MLSKLKISHKVLVLPLLAVVGFTLVFIVIVGGSSRSKAIRKAALDTGFQQTVTAHDSAASDRLSSEFERADAIDRKALTIASIIVVTIVGILIVLTVVINRYLDLMLRRTLKILDRITKGDLTGRMRANRRDEIGLAGIALDHLFSTFEDTVSGFSQSTSTLRTASEQLEATSQEMSSATEETSSQAALVAASTTQVNESIQSVSVAVEQLAASVHEIASNAHQASRIASDAVTAANDTNTTIRSLGRSSSEIDEVVKVINSIAEQTNLLALNATIEAARAGEAGKGFAVVANEVKELARETAEATDDIGNRVTAIQHDAEHAIEAISEIGSVVKTIHDIQTTIATAVEEQSVTTSEIGRSVGEAAGGSSEIAHNVTGLAEAAEATSVGASTTLEAAVRLGQTTHDLETALHQFKFSTTEKETLP